MNSKLKLLAKELKAYDRELVLHQDDHTKKVTIMRKKTYWETVEFEGKTIQYSRTYPDYVISLTKDWKMNSEPVDWGIEPVLNKIKESDPWRDSNYFTDFVKQRENLEAMRRESKRGQIRDLAYDMRREFARATNDINTSTLAKVDSRRDREKNWKMKGK